MKKVSVVLVCCLFLILAFACGDVKPNIAGAAAKESGTLVCTLGYGEQYSTTTLVYKGDVIQKQTDETKADYVQMGYRTEEDFIQAFKKREALYKGIKGVTYTVSSKHPMYLEKIVIDFTVANYAELVSKPQFGLTPGSKYASLKEAKKDMEEIGYKCVYK